METSNLSNSWNYSADDELLRSLTRERFALSIPVLCFICLLMLVGLIGNFLVICTYVKRVSKSSTNMFIFCLATFDLINCTIALPLEIYNLVNPFTNEHRFICSFHRFFGFSADLSSGFIIVCISFDRYLRIARPHQGLSVKGAKIAVLATCIASIAISSLSIFVFGTKVVTFEKYPNIHGHRCGISDSIKDTVWPLFFNIMILISFVVGVIILLTVYILLGIKVRRWSRGRKSKQNRVVRSSEYFQTAIISDDTGSPDSPEPRFSETFTFVPARPVPNAEENKSGFSDGEAAEAKNDSSFKRPVYVRELSRSLDKNQFCKIDDGASVPFHNNGMQTLPVRKPRRATSNVGRKTSMPSLQELKRRMKISRTTVMFISATIAFVVSHLPYAAITIVETVNQDFTKHMSHVGYSLFLFAKYSFVVSYAVNPIIYSFMNAKYRRECKLLLVEISKAIKCHTRRLYFP
ncbi:alpha-2A adrenergic receptor-like [Mya arenaria]|uniref:alpha-2A adrenergic receptor-like n=1 Tax=Mya arenaria TaxID=6604 RepID=UPI0022E88EE4|nr:alpha-2A adrenergic receptor-like [Mya arenaria]